MSTKIQATFFVDALLLAFLLPAITMTTDPECTLIDFQNCLQSLQSATGTDLALATTRQELETVCGTLKKSVHCVDNHMRQCFNPTQRKVFNHVVAGARQVLAEICVPGPIQEGYLKHAPCFKNMSIAESKCSPKYRLLMELSEKAEQTKNVDKGLEEFCCAFREFVQCKHNHANLECDRDAGEYLKTHLDRISSPLIHEHCSQYTYSPTTCSSGSCLYSSVVLILVLWTNTLLKNGVT